MPSFAEAKILVEAATFIQKSIGDFAGEVKGCSATLMDEDPPVSTIHNVVKQFAERLLVALKSSIAKKPNVAFQGKLTDAMAACDVHRAALATVMASEAATASASSPASGASHQSALRKEKKRQARLDAATLVKSMVSDIPEMKYGKLQNNPAHHHTGASFQNLSAIITSEDPDMELKPAEKLTILKPLAVALSAAIANAGGGAVSPDKLVAVLASTENYSVNLLFMLLDPHAKAGSKSGGQRKQTKTTLGDNAEVTTTSGLWRAVTAAQSENEQTVSYTGSQFVTALRTWNMIWFFLRMEMFLPMQCFTSQLCSIVRTSFGFELHECHPYYHQEFLMSLFQLLDTLVAYSKTYTVSSFKPGYMNPLQQAVNCQLPSGSPTDGGGIFVATAALLQVIRDRKRLFAMKSFRTIEDITGRHLVVSDSGKALVYKNKYVSPCPNYVNGNIGTCTVTSHTMSEGKLKHQVKGHVDKQGKLLIH